MLLNLQREITGTITAFRFPKNKYIIKTTKIKRSKEVNSSIAAST